MSDILEDIVGNHEYDTSRWQPIRDEAKTDMRYVAGNPWTKEDEDQRKNRPTVAPEEMGQYFNQVINALRANPRGMKFAPTGNGASEKGAQFYQNKAREIEYRSHAKLAYIGAAENAIQRSYGFVGIDVRYASPRSANQEIWIEGYPNPDMVLPDTDSIRPDGSDMKRCFEFQWVSQKEFVREYGKKAKFVNFGDYRSSNPAWIQGEKILKAKYWAIRTKPRTLLLVQPPAPMAPPRAVVPDGTRPPEPMQVFEDELSTLPPGSMVLRELREVDYPEVKWYITNGLEVLDEGTWLGKYIPIVSCYGKVIYIEGDTGMERKILSMTRFGRDPWKSYCYACSQELEILAQIPKASVKAAAGQLRGYEKDWQEAPHVPKAYLLYHDKDEDGQPYREAPSRMEYTQGEYLQAVEVVKEGFRRAIQAAMGSNFLPTQAQRRNEKSGVALDKMEQAATQGTFHFVNSYEDMIRQVGVITEDLMDKIHDYRGDVNVIEADGKAQAIRINDPNNEKAISTKGDYVVTVSTAPSSDSEQEAAADFLDTLIARIEVIAQIAGPKAAAAIFAMAVRMRNLGPRGDQIADLIEPAEYKSKDGQEPPAPELLAAQAQNQQLQEQLQKLGFAIQTKQVEGQTKYAIEKYKTDATSADKAADREVKIAVAELSAKVTRMELFLEERDRLGVQMQATMERVHQALEGTKQRVHDVAMARTAHQQALEAGAQAHDQALEQGDRVIDGQIATQAAGAALAPPEEAGA